MRMRFNISSIGIRGAAFSSATAINNVGHVIGRSSTLANAISMQTVVPSLAHSFLALSDHTVDLGAGFICLDINDRDEVVGKGATSRAVLSNPFEIQPVLYRAGILSYLVCDGVRIGAAKSINNDGRIAGHVGLPSSISDEQKKKQLVEQLCVWEGGKCRLLPNESGNESAMFMDQNDRGITVGYVRNKTNGIKLPAIWSGNAPIVLDNIDGYGQGVAACINLCGGIVGWTRGYFDVPADHINYHSVRVGRRSCAWFDDAPTDILNSKRVRVQGLDISGENLARAINDDGVIVGEALDVVGRKVAYLWKDWVMHNLNDLVINDKGYRLLSAVDINNSCQIACNGVLDGNIHALLLTPA